MQTTDRPTRLSFRLADIALGDPRGIPTDSDEWQDARYERAQLFDAELAPLVEALRAATLALECHGHRQGDCYSDDYEGHCICGLDNARAALAKAEGRA